jgi:hypothetical protein
VAWFYHGAFDGGIDQLRIAPGFKAVVVSPRELPGLPVSPWHAAVLGAWLEGRTVVELDA